MSYEVKFLDHRGNVFKTETVQDAEVEPGRFDQAAKKAWNQAKERDQDLDLKQVLGARLTREEKYGEQTYRRKHEFARTHLESIIRFSY